MPRDDVGYAAVPAADPGARGRGTRDDEALARELALGYRAVADVPAAVEAIHEAGVLNVDRFDFVGDV